MVRDTSNLICMDAKELSNSSMLEMYHSVSAHWAVAAENAAGAARDPVPAWDTFEFPALNAEELHYGKVQ